MGSIMNAFSNLTPGMKIVFIGIIVAIIFANKGGGKGGQSGGSSGGSTPPPSAS